MIRRPPRSTHCISSAASDVYKRQTQSTWAMLKLISNFIYLKYYVLYMLKQIEAAEIQIVAIKVIFFQQKLYMNQIALRCYSFYHYIKGYKFYNASKQEQQLTNQINQMYHNVNIKRYVRLFAYISYYSIYWVHFLNNSQLLYLFQLYNQYVLLLFENQNRQLIQAAHQNIQFCYVYASSTLENIQSDVIQSCLLYTSPSPRDQA
eukprot:TRINITY_DN7537_c0_g1_i2.p2 TRINITY_DN7537_c0_g1~~TRINITY_DN7537_c0_g1_i2.p2  ORF type:complete len:205 (+),score=24.05 TRINITY_DN7537_c0_g1_i2:120-734(+)